MDKKDTSARKVYAWSMTVEDYNKLHEMAKESGMAISQLLRERIFPQTEEPKVEKKSEKEPEPVTPEMQPEELPAGEEEVIVFDEETK